MFSHRFILQAFHPDDQPFVFQGLSHPEVIRFYGVQFHSLEATRLQMEWFEEIIKGNSGHWWKIVHWETGEKVGAIGMNNYEAQNRSTEIGYWLLPQYWKQGIIGEVLPVVLDYVFRQRAVHRVSASVEEGNDASCRVLEKAGFRLEGTQRDCEYKGGRFISLRWYSLLEPEWTLQRRSGVLWTERSS